MSEPEQPMPVRNGRQAIVDMVVEDLERMTVSAAWARIRDQVVADLWARKRVGVERYGVALQAFNGRDALRDAYEEALDLTVYLRQRVEEHPDDEDAAEDFRLARDLTLRLRTRQPWRA